MSDGTSSGPPSEHARRGIELLLPDDLPSGRRRARSPRPRRRCNEPRRRGVARPATGLSDQRTRRPTARSLALPGRRRRPRTSQANPESERCRRRAASLRASSCRRRGTDSNRPGANPRERPSNSARAPPSQPTPSLGTNTRDVQTMGQPRGRGLSSPAASASPVPAGVEPHRPTCPQSHSKQKGPGGKWLSRAPQPRLQPKWPRPRERA